MGTIKTFMTEHYRHFNAAAVIDGAEAYCQHIQKGGKIFMTLAGAMSTAELGKSLAEMIRKDKVHGISCTGANLEEDIFNLVAHESYLRVPNFRNLTPKDEMNLLKKHMNRVTDTCIPEEEAMRKVEKPLFKLWKDADQKGERKFPHEFIYELLKGGALKEHYQIDPKNSWVMAAMEKNLPIFIPGWEDSTLANFFVSHCVEKRLKNLSTVRQGLEYMVELSKWYEKESKKNSIGFFQIGGGIAGDFPICVVPMLNQDLERDVPLWGYFCQISDSTTSYGSYSGAIPSEKITWGKLDANTPMFVIESDATIVAPLIFAYVLNW